MIQNKRSTTSANKWDARVCSPKHQLTKIGCAKLKEKKCCSQSGAKAFLVQYKKCPPAPSPLPAFWFVPLLFPPLCLLVRSSLCSCSLVEFLFPLFLLIFFFFLLVLVLYLPFVFFSSSIGRSIKGFLWRKTDKNNNNETNHCPLLVLCCCCCCCC